MFSVLVAVFCASIARAEEPVAAPAPPASPAALTVTIVPLAQLKDERGGEAFGAIRDRLGCQVVAVDEPIENNPQGRLHQNISLSVASAMGIFGPVREAAR
jgi:hypothetical protein